jgi:tetratricopeptide (TPR) repeat protein
MNLFRSPSRDAPPVKVEVKNTGDASSTNVANTGVIYGDINVFTGSPVRTRYREQVRRIAPPELVGRDAELAELAAFCSDSSFAGCYRWWQAPAWAGKTALLSWFVLHPPPGVRIVSFFITSRLSNQNTKAAFIDNIVEQLATILDQPLPMLTESTREGHLLWMLREAAEACAQRQERFVLVVDGLDEDRGVTVSPEAYSIAALLPPQLDHGMRVLVTGRKHPLPADVPDPHPLRAGIVQPLTPSKEAKAIQEETKRDLKRLLAGTGLERGLLGLLTAAGGLTAADLAELTGCSTEEIKDHLGTVSGRSFTTRPGRWCGLDGYLLAHDELQRTAVKMLGPRVMAAHRQQIADWYDEHRDAGWRPQTPDYLLDGYFNMLGACGDLNRMVVCATDPIRHDRMRDASGGDLLALDEIAAVENALAAQADPDLPTLARVAVHHDRLRDRDRSIPRSLPAAWAHLGQINIAEALARSITDPNFRDQALAAVAETVAARGDPDRAETLADSITAPDQKARVQAAVISAVALTGDLERAETLAYSISNPHAQARALAAVVEARAVVGDSDRAARLVDHAETLACSIGDPYFQAAALAALAPAIAQTGDPNRVTRMLDHAETLADSITDPYMQAGALTALAPAVAQTGDANRARRLVDRAENLTHSISTPLQQAWALASLAQAVTALGDPARATQVVDRAETLVHTIAGPMLQAWALAEMSPAVADNGDAERATQLVERAETLTRSIDNFDRQAETLIALIPAVAQNEAPNRAKRLIERAETLIRSITIPRRQAEMLATLAQATTATGNLDLAESLACSITEPYWQARSLAILAPSSDDPDHATQLVDQAESLIHSITAAARQVEMLATLAQVVTAIGDPDRAARQIDRAETLAHSITTPSERAWALAVVALEAARSGDSGRATQLLNQAETLIRSITDPGRQNLALVALVQAVAASGDLVRAQSLTQSITDPAQQNLALVALVQAVAASGDLVRAQSLTQSITGPWPQAEALIALARAVAARGDPDRAQELIRSITDPDQQARALAGLVRFCGQPVAAKLIARVLQLRGLNGIGEVFPAAQTSVALAIVDELGLLHGW